MSPCMRCRGLIIIQYIPFTRFDELRYFPTYMFRCLNCGDYFDALVLMNRQIFYALLDEKYKHGDATIRSRSPTQMIIQIIKERKDTAKHNVQRAGQKHRDISRYV